MGTRLMTLTSSGRLELEGADQGILIRSTHPDGGQIEWRSPGSPRHWNIDQVTDGRLRFFTEDNNNHNGKERITFLENGNVGIGTTNPLASLHVNNGDNSYGTILASADESSFSLYAKTLTTQPANVESFRLGLKHGDNEDNGYISFYKGGSGNGGFLGFSTHGTERIRISQNGNVGIGTVAPTAKLEVNGTNPGILIRSDSYDGGQIEWRMPNTTQHWNIDQFEDRLRFFVEEVDGAGIEAISFLGNGNVGIGTISPSEKLEVSGKVKADGVVLNIGTFPDYVSADDYKLITLEELEAHIQAHGHLPKFPSEKEVVQHGADLGQLNTLLVEKVEELTLYTIAQEKQLKALQEALAQQQAQIQRLLEDK